MKLLEEKIKSLLKEHVYIVEPTASSKKEFEYLINRYKEELDEVLEDLDYIQKPPIENLPFLISTDQFIIDIWDVLDFNRYRLKTLRSEVYNTIT